MQLGRKAQRLFTVPGSRKVSAVRTGWLEEAETKRYDVTFTPESEVNCAEILSDSGTDLQNICRVQLSYSPLDSSRKKLKQLSENCWQILIRNYFIDFVIDPDLHTVSVTGITRKI